MFIYIEGVLLESYELFLQMGPYLLFGFFFAGLLHVFISIDYISKHLGKSSIGSIFKAVILGIPLPLCSCGVLPAAISLEKKGASRGAVISFLIATPITGVDSIFATYSLLGFTFAVFRVIASMLTAVVAGILSLLFHKEVPKQESEETPSCHEDQCHCSIDGANEEDKAPQRNKIKELFSYAFGQLLGEIWKSLLVGIIIAGIIAYLIPDTVIQKYLGDSWKSMFVMLVAGIPMYVCSTGSIPIAASLMMKGMSPGAALVFLLAGPATNAVAIAVVSRELGKKATFLYVATIGFMSVLMGILLNQIWYHINIVIPKSLAQMTMLPKWVETSSGIILGLLIVYHAFMFFFYKLGARKS